MTKTINSKHFRHRLFSRLRHGRKLNTFLVNEAAALASSATAQTVAPVRTTNTKAEALAVFASNPANLDTLLVGNRTYTFRTALTEAKALATLTNDATNVSNADTVTIDGKVYTFQTALTNVDGHVLIGASATASMTNLFHAINASGGTAGTDYAALTTAHPTVVATNPTATTVVVTAKTQGVAGNAIAISEASTHLTWGASVTLLSGGVAAVADQVLIGALATDSRDNLVAAITAGSGVGVKYSTGTVAHTLVTAATATNDALLTALTEANLQPGNKIRLVSSGAHITVPGTFDGPAWTATSHTYVDGEGPVLLTSSGSLPAASPALGTGLWVHVISASKIALATSLGALRRGDFVQTTSAGSGTHSLTKDTTASGMMEILKRNVPRTIQAATDIDSLR